MITQPFVKSIYLFRILRVLFTLFCLACLTAISGYAQNGYVTIGTPPITNFKRSQYAAGTQNWSINQDKKGTIHFGNNKGLLRFDGIHWSVKQLPNYTILRSLEFGPENRVYLGGQNEIGYIANGTAGVDQYHSLTSLIPKENKDFEDVWEVFTSGHDVLFCSEKAVFVINAAGCSVIEPPGNRFENYFQTSDRIFFQDKEKGLFEWSGEKLRKIQGEEKFKNDRVAAILPYSSEKLLIVTVSEGFYFLENNEILPWEIKATSFAKTNQPYCATMLRNGKYAIGTAQNGFFLINRDGEITQHINMSMGLQNNTVLSIFQDAQDNLWLGLDNGIDYVEINSAFRMIQSELGVNGTGYAAKIYNGDLYLGTNQGLYRKPWRPNESTGQNIPFSLLPNTKGQIWGLNRIDESLIVGRHSGADIITAEGIDNFSDIGGAWKFMELRKYPNYLLEGTYAGFYLYRKNSANPVKLENLGKLKGFDESSRIFEEDDDGNIWVSHAYRGLYKIELSGDITKI